MAAIPAHPFTYSSADVVLYSSDNVVYKVHKLILAIASDFFRDMFDLPQPTSSSDSDSSAPVTEEQVDGLPVIRMLESSKALTPLLMLCYPLEEPVLTSITEVCAVLEAAIKFDLRRASQIAKRRMRELIPSAPLRVYIIACRLGLEDEAHAAAQEIYRSKVQDQYVEKLEEISFGAYHRLLHYCSAGGDAGFGMVSVSPTKSGPKSKKDKKKADVDRSRAITFTVPVSTATPDVSTIGSPTPVLSTGDVNIVLLTSDGQRLPISGNGILYASPLLSALVARRSNIAEEVPVTEPAATMSILIRVYDPFEQPHFADLLDIHAGLIAAEKYGMRKAIDFIRKNPLS
ncbi:hypothetical protein BD311DRAFT_747033 [Dichomitus squalens]|uniref:BTB domain-containing protein n=1 Tax=Dichomitus squalens TaxID=114155 RepID=A0A4Q9N1N7_9APHY|nr:hypothetical protein BD311DRAFT_747033 [Dichomitus squalens]